MGHTLSLIHRHQFAWEWGGGGEGGEGKGEDCLTKKAFARISRTLGSSHHLKENHFRCTLEISVGWGEIIYFSESNFHHIFVLPSARNQRDCLKTCWSPNWGVEERGTIFLAHTPMTFVTKLDISPHTRSAGVRSFGESIYRYSLVC